MNAWLAVDTATDVAGVALHDGAGVVAEHTWLTRRRHTAELAPVVAQVLAEAGRRPADLAGVAVALGPGSYTGLRIGLALAKGLALGAGVPVVGVPTLDILAVSLSPPQVPRAVPLWAVLRAGRSRWVAACYPPTADDWPAGDRLAALSAEELLTWVLPPAWVAGELGAPERRALAAAGLTVLAPAASLRRAGWLAELGRQRFAARGADDPDRLVPIYLGAEAG